jgi:uncharacterized protein (DUF1778 family)
MNENRAPRTKWLTLRVREPEREALRAAARKTGQWSSEFAREAICLRVRQVLAETPHTN